MYKNLNLCTTTTSEGGRRDCRVVRVNINFFFFLSFGYFFLKEIRRWWWNSYHVGWFRRVARLLDVEHQRRETAKSDIFGQFDSFVTCLNWFLFIFSHPRNETDEERISNGKTVENDIRTFQLVVAYFDLTRVEATQKVNQRGQTCPGCSRRSKGKNI